MEEQTIFSEIFTVKHDSIPFMLAFDRGDENIFFFFWLWYTGLYLASLYFIGS